MPKEDFTGWTRNVSDRFRDMSTEDIKKSLQETARPFAVLMEHWSGDFNISTLIRNANAFNAKEIYYIGKKKWDRRGAVGTHHYVDVFHLGDELEGFKNLMKLKERYTFVAFENNPANERTTHRLDQFIWPKNPLMIFGEEGQGVSLPVLAMAEEVVEIPQFGSVRSLNVGTASGITMYDWHSKNTTGEN